jgi:electron transport complex protein RnfB
VIVIEIVLLLVLGLAFGVGLAFASKKLVVRVDERIAKITDLLPGANCGACGFSGCSSFASSLTADPSTINRCALCDVSARKSIGGILGVEMKEEKPRVAVVACTYGSGDKFEYEGVGTCAAASLLMGGFKECKHACLGLGDCLLACPFDAITLKDHMVFVDRDKCTGCGSCLNACPRCIIKLVDRDAKVFVACNSLEAGKVVAKMCKTGCVACRLCEKQCRLNAIEIENNLAVIDHSICNGCGACVEACGRNAIVRLAPKSVPTSKFARILTDFNS